MTDYNAKCDYYGSTAAVYDTTRFESWKGRWLDAREKSSVTRALSVVDRDHTILDLPCGTGRITEHLLALGYCVTGADVSTDMIALAKRRLRDRARLCGFYEIDAEDIALPKDSFDCITSVRFMGHLPHSVKARVLREMARVARRHVIVTFYFGGLLRCLKWRVTRSGDMRRAQWYPVGHRELEALFAACSLVPEARWRVCPLLSDAVTYRLRVDGP